MYIDYTYDSSILSLVLILIPDHWFSLVSSLNEISTFVDYLMPKPFFQIFNVLQIYVFIYPYTLSEYDPRSIFRVSWTGLNSEFFFF